MNRKSIIICIGKVLLLRYSALDFPDIKNGGQSTVMFLIKATLVRHDVVKGSSLLVNFKKGGRVGEVEK